jgi:signal transduction histidine kinase/ligand-binding sensor domain-containing protein
MAFFFRYIGHSQIYPFQLYTVKDGLLSNTVNCLYQDTKGYLWIGTNEGISRYDGTSFFNYTHTSDGSLIQNVNDIQQDRTDSTALWFSTWHGMVRLSGDSLRVYHIIESGQSDFVTSFYQSDCDTILCCTGDGLYALDVRRNSVFSLHPLMKEHTGPIFDMGGGLLYIGSQHGLFFTHNSTEQPQRANLGAFSQNYVTALCVDREKKFWIALEGGYVLHVEGSKVLEQRKIVTESDHPTPSFLIDDGQGSLLVGDHSGLYKVSKAHFLTARIEHVTESGGIPSTAVSSAVVDRENVLWIGLENHGLAKFAQRNIVQFPLGERNWIGNNADACSDANGHLWIVENSGVREIWRDPEGGWRQYLHAEVVDNQSGVPINVRRDHDGRLWLLYADGSGGIRCYDVFSQSTEHFTLQERLSYPAEAAFPIPRPNIFSFIVDRYQRLWLGLAEGIFVLDIMKDEKKFKRAGSTSPLFPDDVPRGLADDRYGNVWIGWNSSGVTRYDPATPSSANFTIKDGLPGDRVRAIFQDRDDRIWFGTRYCGIGYLEGKKFPHVNADQRITSVLSVAQDSAGAFWIGTSTGLFACSNPMSGNARLINESVGSGVNGVGVLPDGTVWFATHENLTLLDRESETREHHLPPPVYLTHLDVNERPRGMNSQLLDLVYSENNFRIQFVGISMRDERSVHYRYRLKGLDDSWSQPVTNNFVTYAALQPANYTFEVLAVTGDGIESAMPASLVFTIHSPLWLRWWFVVAVFIVVVGTIVFIVRMRVRRLLEIERIRTRIATDLHDDIGASLTRISLSSAVVGQEVRTLLSTAETDRSGKLLSYLDEIGTNSRDLIDSMSDIVWSVNPQNDTFENLALRMKNHLAKVLEAARIDYEIDIDPALASLYLPLDLKRNLYLIFKEGLNNVVRHAQGTRVSFSIRRDKSNLVMVMKDDGRGFLPDGQKKGNGLKNMTMRAAASRGTFEATSSPGNGTTLTARFKLP